MFSSPVAISASTTYLATYTAPAGGYSVTTGDLATARTSGTVRSAARAGRLISTTGVVTTSNDNYFVDALVAVPNA